MVAARKGGGGKAISVATKTITPRFFLVSYFTRLCYLKAEYDALDCVMLGVYADLEVSLLADTGR